MPDADSIVPIIPGALAARERAIANSQIDHGAIYKHVAATKIEIFGPKTFSTCPQCDREYRLFNNPYWKGDQSVCQACADENFAATRAIMQGIEASFAKRELQRLGDNSETWGPFVALSGVPA